MIHVPDQVRGTAERLGDVGVAWLRELPDLVSTLEREWGITTGEPFGQGFTGLVLDAVDDDERRVVLKLGVPDGLKGISPFSQELGVLLLAGGHPYVEVLRHDVDRRVMLMERLGRPIAHIGLPFDAQLDVIARTLPAGWKRVENVSLSTGAEKAAWLRRFIGRRWSEDLCTSQTRDLAIEYSRRREAAFDPASGVLIHGDAHVENILEVAEGADEFVLIDPEGLVAEPAHDLAIPLRGTPPELMQGDAVDLLGRWTDRLADATGVDRDAIWEWSFIERVSSGFNLTSFGMAEEGSAYLGVADQVSAATADTDR